MPILTIRVHPSFTSWFGHEETKSAVLSVHQVSHDDKTHWIKH